MAKIQVSSGHIGYRDQLDRARRFLDRVEGPHRNDVDFQDMMWAFFQNCFHLRDWVVRDPLMSSAQKDAVLAKAGASIPLRRCGDLCNGTKHLVPKATQHSHVNITIQPGTDRPSELDSIIDVGGGQLISGKQLARDCLSDWERILESEKLATARRS